MKGSQIISLGVNTIGNAKSAERYIFGNKMFATLMSVRYSRRNSAVFICENMKKYIDI